LRREGIIIAFMGYSDLQLPAERAQRIAIESVGRTAPTVSRTK
jgi:hypothetical protein